MFELSRPSSDQANIFVLRKAEVHAPMYFLHSHRAGSYVDHHRVSAAAVCQILATIESALRTAS